MPAVTDCHGASRHEHACIDPLTLRGADVCAGASPLPISSARAPAVEAMEPRLMLSASQQLSALGSALLVANQGQWSDHSVSFALDGAGCDVALRDSAIQLRLSAQDGSSADLADTILIDFGADRPVTPIGLDPSAATFNYLLDDSSSWVSSVQAFESACYMGLYPGIDLQVGGWRTGLKYEFRVAPGADYRSVQLTYGGSEGLYLDDAGALHIRTAAGELIDQAPLIYQDIAGRRVEVAGAFTLIDADTCGFVVSGAYDPSQTLVIDPDMVWSTFGGGAGYDEGNAVATDASGNVYVTGRTESTAWATAGAADATYGGSYDAYVAKLSAAGSLLWCTYLGGEGFDSGYGIAVDPAGRAYVVGDTGSGTWATASAYDTTLGTRDAFVARLAADGSGIDWCTYLGGSTTDLARGIALDGAGNAYVTGYSDSPGWATAGSYDSTYNSGRDAFVAKVSAEGSQLLWCTYLGGVGAEAGYGIAVDSSQSVYVAGETSSGGWATAGAYDTSHGGNADIFVAKLSSAGDQMVYATYLGGASQDVGFGIALDVANCAYVTGQTFSTGWATAGAYDTTNGGSADIFVAKLDAAGSGLAYATYLGGQYQDLGYGIAVDPGGSAYVVGQSASPNLATSEAFDTTYGGNGDGLLAKLSADGVHLLYATYLGGSDADSAAAVAIDALGTACVVGKTSSAGWTSAGSYGGATDLFVAKLALVEQPPDISVWDAQTEIVSGQSQAVVVGSAPWGAPGAAHTFSIRNDGDLPLTLNTPFADTAHFVVSEPDRTSLGPGESATFTVTLKTDVAWAGTETILIASSDPDESPFGFSASGTVIAPASIAVGTAHVAANAASQRIALYVTGGAMVTGFNLRAQIGDGPGGAADPVFTGIEFAGGIWSGKDITVIGGPIAGSAQYAQASVAFGGAGDQTSAEGLLVVLVIDTRGFATEQSFELSLSATGLGADSDFVTVGGGTFIPTIYNGTVRLHDAQVVGRQVFYNHSYFDGNDPSASAADDAAIALAKLALLPGQAATTANFTNFSRGINGLMIDIRGMADTPTLSDFLFRTGTAGDPAGWSTATAPQSVSVRRGEGEGGSDRVTIIWGDGAILNTWLQVTVLASGSTTGLGQQDVFYFGNAVGDTFNQSANAIVDFADFQAVHDHWRHAMNRATMGEAWDVNRDSFVDGTDLVIVRDHATDAASALPLLTAAQTTQPATGLLATEPPAPQTPSSDTPAQTSQSDPASTADQPAGVTPASGAIVVGVARVEPDTRAQRIPIHISGAALMAGFNLRAQIGDGPGGASEPIFTAIEFDGLWEGLQTTVIGGVIAGSAQYAQASVVLTAAHSQVPAAGLLVTLVIDTTGFDGGQTFPLLLRSTQLGSASDAVTEGGGTLAPTITNGTVQIDLKQATYFELPLAGKYSFVDADGQWVLLAIKGGTGLLRFDLPFADPTAARQDLRQIVLTPATPTTALSLSIRTKGRGSATTVGDITVEGTLRSLSAATTDLTGSLIVRRGASAIRLDDLGSASLIEINQLDVDLDPRLSAKIAVDQAGAGARLISHGEGIRSLSAGSWRGGRIEAPWIGKLAVRGESAADVTLSGKPTGNVLGAAKIVGSLSGSWDLVGSVGSLKVYGPSEADLDVSGDVGAISTFNWRGGACRRGRSARSRPRAGATARATSRRR